VVSGGGVGSTGVRWIEEDRVDFFSDVVLRCIFTDGGVNKGDNGDGGCKIRNRLVEKVRDENQDLPLDRRMVLFLAILSLAPH
jgi:hypothetical protein